MNLLTTTGLLTVFSLVCISAVSSEDDGTKPGFSATVSLCYVDDEDNMFKTVTVSGPGISDQLKEDCDMDSYVIASSDSLVVGDSIYSDKANQLIVVKDGKCELRTYKDGAYQSSSEMSSEDCEKVKKSIKDAKDQAGGKFGEGGNSGEEGGNSGEESGNSGEEGGNSGEEGGNSGEEGGNWGGNSGEEGGNWGGNSGEEGGNSGEEGGNSGGEGGSSSDWSVYSATVSRCYLNDQGNRVKTVTISGRGINDKLDEDCDIDNYVVANSDCLLVGGRLYSDERNKLVVVKDGKCELRTYKDGAYQSTSEMTSEDCFKVKRSMEEAKNRGDGRFGQGGNWSGEGGNSGEEGGNSSEEGGNSGGEGGSSSDWSVYSATVSRCYINDQGNRVKTVTISGRGINDKLDEDCDIDNYVVANSDCLLVGGRLYSDERNKLVVVKDGKCELRTYKDGAYQSTS
ncbi:hypothetical protein J6590_025241 [Homalodisca vitripennis]|nr:hypothetical protein J6590_025241 [Homalodisca vitripennis]